MSSRQYTSETCKQMWLRYPNVVKKKNTILKVVFVTQYTFACPRGFLHFSAPAKAHYKRWWNSILWVKHQETSANTLRYTNNRILKYANTKILMPANVTCSMNDMHDRCAGQTWTIFVIIFISYIFLHSCIFYTYLYSVDFVLSFQKEWPTSWILWWRAW